MSEESPKPPLWLLITGVVLGAAYGLLFRLADRVYPRSTAFAVMTVGFIFLVPLTIGFLAVFVMERVRPQSVGRWLMASCLAVLAALAGTALVALEGIICVVMFAPIGLITGMTGGLAAGLILRFWRSRKNASLACVMLLPLLVSPIEEPFLRNQEVRSVENVIDINASPDTVWRNIERVPAINPAELQSSWSHRIGFPNPIEAALSREGIGGVREATFEGGILFLETIDVWEPQRRLGFSIRPQTARIPPTTLDEHVTVGGKYFDVLHGEYRLEPLPNGRIRLHLVSRHRVSTDFNWYAHLWTDAVMSDLQKRILYVVRNRCESQNTSGR